MFEAWYSQAHDDRDQLKITYTLPNTPETATVVIEAKVRTLRTLLGAAGGFPLSPDALARLVDDVSVACGELIAILQAVRRESAQLAKVVVRENRHAWHATYNSLPEVERALTEAYDFLESHARNGEPVVKQPLGPNWWPVGTDMFRLDWSAIARNNHVS